jgi:hypothetical protein
LQNGTSSPAGHPPGRRFELSQGIGRFWKRRKEWVWDKKFELVAEKSIGIILKNIVDQFAET